MKPTVKELLLKLVADYIEEAEHQDGPEYWEGMSMSELLADLNTYYYETSGDTPPQD